MAEQGPVLGTAYCMHCGATNTIREDSLFYVMMGVYYVKCRCGLLLPW
jgi:hypothetical protein